MKGPSTVAGAVLLMLAADLEAEGRREPQHPGRTQDAVGDTAQVTIKKQVFETFSL
jgi:hypothetical protein